MCKTPALQSARPAAWTPEGLLLSIKMQSWMFLKRRGLATFLNLCVRFYSYSLAFMWTKKSGTKNSLLDKIEIEESEKENDIDNEDEDIDQTIKINKQQTEVKPSNYALSTEWSIKDWLNLIEGKINYVK